MCYCFIYKSKPAIKPLDFIVLPLTNTMSILLYLVTQTETIVHEMQYLQHIYFWMALPNILIYHKMSHGGHNLELLGCKWVVNLFSQADMSLDCKKTASVTGAREPLETILILERNPIKKERVSEYERDSVIIYR